MRKSLLPTAGENLFQRVKRQCTEAENLGVKLFRVSIGQPSGPAILEAREAASKAVMSYDESMHEYQDNGSPGVTDFARRFVQCHVKTELSKIGPDQIDYLPAPGLKPMLFVVMAASGSWVKDVRRRIVWSMTEPGYPTPRDQAQWLPNIRHFDVKVRPSEGFLFRPEDLESQYMPIEGDLLMLNFPHNPCGIIATKEWLEGICAYCAPRGIRIFNDGAYHILSHTDGAVTLADVALRYPGLNWAEGYSASKAGNFTGWRVAAICGSPEFVGDIKRVKGNLDSGYAAPLAAGVIHLFENHKDKIREVRELYSYRLGTFKAILKSAGMKLSVDPAAGFFALYNTPTIAFGEKVESADHFCKLMIDKTGIVGIPFHPYVRYAVCAADVVANESRIFEAFEQANVHYEADPVAA